MVKGLCKLTDDIRCTIIYTMSSCSLDSYRNVEDAMGLGDNDMQSLGRRYILPSGFEGSPRHMHKLYQDAISIVRRFGKPHLFITFTCNPAWPEIQDNLIPPQTAPDRPDLTARMFRLKMKEFMDDLTRRHVLGRVVAHVHTIEFQKRGLPHAHILLILTPDDVPDDADKVDSIVSAEIPDRTGYPDAYATVKRFMVHGPCTAARCLNEHGRCICGVQED